MLKRIGVDSFAFALREQRDGRTGGTWRTPYLDRYELSFGPGEHSIVAIVSGFGGKGAFPRMEFRHGFFFAADSTSAFIAMPEGLSGEFRCPDGRVIALKSGKQHINDR